MKLRKKIILGAAVLAAAATAYFFVSGAAEDRWTCISELDRYVPHESVWIRVPQARRQQLVQYVESFAEEKDLLFGMSEDRAHPLGIEHDTVAMQTCNRTINISLRNTHRAELFAVHTSQNRSKSFHQFNGLHAPFRKGLVARFERATEAEVKEAHE
jgi:hypothetical protein